MRKLLCVATIVVAAAGCDKGADGAINLIVDLEPALKADCVGVDVTHDGTRLGSSVAKRGATSNRLEYAIKQNDFPATVTLEVTAYLGSNCDDAATRKLASRAEPKVVTFPKSTIERITMTVGLPDAALDQDRDGFVAQASGGVDCDDQAVGTFPGATQKCDADVDTNCDGKKNCEDPQCSTAAICQRNADRLAFASSVSSVKVFDCSQALVVESRDASGIVTANRNLPLTLTGSIPGTEFFSDAQCQTPFPAAGPRIAFNTSSLTFFVRTTARGALTLSVASPGFTTVTTMLTVDPQPIAKIVLTPPNLSVTAGMCSTIDGAVFDAADRPTVATTDVDLQLNAVAATTTTFHDPVSDFGCVSSTTTMPSVRLAQGEGTFQFLLKAKQATTTVVNNQVVAGPDAVVTVGSATIPAATLSVAVTAGMPAQLAFASAEPGVLVNTCSGGIVSVQTRDGFGNATNAPAQIEVALSSAPTTADGGVLVFFSDTACTMAIGGSATVPIPQGRAGTTVAIRGTKAGRYNMRASSVGTALAAADQGASIANGKPEQIANVTPAAITSVAGKCSPAQVVLETRDSSGVRSGVVDGPVSVQLSNSGGLTFYSDSTCATQLPGGVLVISPGSAEGTFYFKGNIARKAPTGTDITAVASGFSGTTATSQATIKVFVDPGVPFRLKWAGTSAYTVKAGVCAGPYTLEARDDQDNLTSYNALTSVAVSTVPSGGSAAFFAASNCTGAGASFATGVSTTQLYGRANTAQTYTLSSVAGGIASAATPVAQLVVDPADVSQLVLLAAPSGNVPAGRCDQVQVQRQDPFGNAAPVTASTTFTVAMPTGGAAYNTLADCTTNPNTTAVASVAISSGATATFYVRTTRAGASTMTITQGALTVNRSYTTTSGASAKVVFTNPSSGGATFGAGSCFQNVQVERRDSFDNPVTTDSNPLTLNISGSGVSGVGFSSTPTSCSGATATLGKDIPASMAATSFAVTATQNGTLTVSVTSAAGNTSTSFTVNVGTPTQVVQTITPPSPSVTAGSCFEVRVEVRDASGNASPVSGNFIVSDITPAATMTTYTSLSNCNSQSGATTSFAVSNSATLSVFVRSTRVGANSLKITPPGASFSTTPAWTVVSAAASQLVWVAPTGGSLAADACSAEATIERRDPFGNLATTGNLMVSIAASGAAAASAVFSTTSANCTATAAGPLALTIVDGASSAKFAFKSQTAGSLTLTPTSTLSTNPAVTLTVTPGSISQIVFTNPLSIATAGGCQSLTIEGRDAFGNVVAPAPAATLNLSATTGTADFYSTGSCTGGLVTSVSLSSTAVTFSFRPKTAPTTTVQALRSTPNPVLSASQAWSVSPAAASKLVWLSPPSTAARFACVPLTVGVQDTYNNTATNTSPRTLNLSSDGTAGQLFFSDAACTSLITTVPLNAGSQQTSTFYGMFTGGASSATITAGETPGPGVLTGASASVGLTGTSGAMVVDGPSSAVQAYDCVAVTVRRTNGAGTNFAFGNKSVTVSSGAPSRLALFDDPACATPVTSPFSISNTQDQRVIYAKGRGGDVGGSVVVVTATDTTGAFTAGTANVTVPQMVRSGTCTITALVASLSANCDVPGVAATDLPTTFMTFQATPSSTGANPQETNVECHLEPDGANVDISCSRASGSLTLSIAINWQVVTFGAGAGVTVAHTNNVAVSDASPDVTLAAPVDPTKSFVLASYKSNATSHTADRFVTAILKNATTVSFQAGVPTYDATASFQVVQLTGATVTNGTLSFAVAAASNSNTNILTSTTLSEAFPLFGVQAGPTADSGAVCKKRFRGWFTQNSTHLNFNASRGNGTTAQCVESEATLAIQAVKLPTGWGTVRSADVSIASGATTGTGAIVSPVERTIVFLAGQGAGGQVTGEVDETTSSNVVRFNGLVSFNGTVVTVARAVGPGSGAAVFTPYAIEFTP